MNGSHMLYEALDVLHRKQDGGHRYLRDDGEYSYRTYSNLIKEASSIKSGLANAGIEKGDRVALIVVDQASFVASFVACVIGGYIAVPLNVPVLNAQLEQYVRNIDNVLGVADVKAVLYSCASRKVIDALSEKYVKLSLELESMVSSDGSEYQRESLQPEDICFLQFTSGSTGAPKGVIVTYKNLAANCFSIIEDGVKIVDGDIGLSWLPMYHDMGLIGKVLAPLSYGVEMVYIPTRTFVKKPQIWMEAMSLFGATISFGPNFAFALAAKRFRRHSHDVDLSKLRVLGCGAEPIKPEVLKEFVDCFAPFGLKPEAIMPCYGLAEATLAVSFANDASYPKVLSIAKERYVENIAQNLEKSESCDCLDIVSCGRPLAGNLVGIYDSQGNEIEDGIIGEIWVKGPSVSSGYYGQSGPDDTFRDDGWLRTGDLGFFNDGELFVSGRLKDIIIVNGKNYYPQDIEWEVEQVDAVRQGNVAAFGVTTDSGEVLVVAAEVKGSVERQEIRNQVSKKVSEACGLIPNDVILLPGGSLPKTSSGKIRRHQIKRFYQSGVYDNKDCSQSKPQGQKENSKDVGEPLLGGGKTISLVHKVRPSDLDAFGHVNNARVLEYLELGRLDWLQHNAIDAGSDVVPVLSKIELQYVNEIFLCDVEIRTTLTSQAYYTVKFSQEVVSKDDAGKVYAKADVTINFIDLVTRRPKRLKEYIKKK